MCFIKDTYYKHRKVKIAGKNIPCFKILTQTTTGYKSPFQYEQYFNKVDSVVVKKAKFANNHKKSTLLYEGLHSYSTEIVARMNRSLSGTLFKAYIPKGTRYYYNHEAHEYVSEKLIVYNNKCSKENKTV